jgi:[ribosomal protein S18]-alanine N-acetyltransferase
MTAEALALVRPMAEADLDAVLALAAALPTAPQWPRSAYNIALNAASLPPRVALVADLGGASIAGFAVASLMPPEAELETLAVAELHQRRGIARALLNELLPRLLVRGVTALHLEVRISNEPACAFYEMSGFRKSGIRNGYYTDPIEDAAIFSLDLA